MTNKESMRIRASFDGSISVGLLRFLPNYVRLLTRKFSRSAISPAAKRGFSLAHPLRRFRNEARASMQNRRSNFSLSVASRLSSLPQRKHKSAAATPISHLWTVCRRFPSLHPATARGTRFFEKGGQFHSCCVLALILAFPTQRPDHNRPVSGVAPRSSWENSQLQNRRDIVILRLCHIFEPEPRSSRHLCADGPLWMKPIDPGSGRPYGSTC